MAKKDIFKTDNWFITIGVIFIFFGGLVTLGSILQTNNIQLGGIIFLLSGITLLFFGLIVRKKEKKIIGIWEVLEDVGEIEVNELAQSLGLTKEFILNNLKHINIQRNVYFKYDAKYDKIVNRDLATQHKVDAKCSGCGNSISKSIPLHSTEIVNCNYCGNPISTEEIAKIKNEIRNQTREIEPEKSDFNKTIFIVLLFFCWPGAIVYYVIKNK